MQLSESLSDELLLQIKMLVKSARKSDTLPEQSSNAPILGGLQKLGNENDVRRFIQVAIAFSNEYLEVERTHTSAEGQELVNEPQRYFADYFLALVSWAILNDPTQLSFMQQSLQTKHEGLLTLDEDKHPPYINSNCLKAYKALFKPHGFCCRFKSCPASNAGFPSTKARASHETEHFPTYRCEECDFSVRGFRSKGDLVNHVNKYHANIENTKLPAELLPPSPQPGQAPPTPNPSVPPRRSRRGGAARNTNKKNVNVVDDEAEEPDADADVDMEGEDTKEYCFCHSVSYGDMVGCENDQCPYEWFHLKCVGLKEPPPESAVWYCPECRTKPGMAMKMK
jgi:hypothetical protein